VGLLRERRATSGKGDGVKEALKNWETDFLTEGNEENEGHNDLGQPASLRCFLIFCSKSDGSLQSEGE
jgi:hypothetical protein